MWLASIITLIIMVFFLWVTWTIATHLDNNPKMRDYYGNPREDGE